jgi:hypothetical protein
MSWPCAVPAGLARKRYLTRHCRAGLQFVPSLRDYLRCRALPGRVWRKSEAAIRPSLRNFEWAAARTARRKWRRHTLSGWPRSLRNKILFDARSTGERGESHISRKTREMSRISCTQLSTGPRVRPRNYTGNRGCRAPGDCCGARVQRRVPARTTCEAKPRSQKRDLGHPPDFD